MVSGEDSVERLVEALRQDAQARTLELANLNEQLEERSRVLERQLGKRAGAAKWYAMLAALLAIGVGAWVYTLMLQMSQDVDSMSQRIGQMQIYMRNMGAGKPAKGESGFLAGISQNTGRMSADTVAMREAMQAMSGDISGMRQAMEEMRGNIGNMNRTMGSLGNDMKDMTDNVAGMAKSIGYMNRSVGRLSRDADSLRGPFPGMNSVMPWR